MSKIIHILIVTGFLGMLNGCASKPQPVESNHQEQIAKAEIERRAALAIAEAEAERNAALAAAEEAKKELARIKEENDRVKKVFRKGLLK